MKQKELGNEWSTSSSCSHWRPNTCKDKARVTISPQSNLDRLGHGVGTWSDHTRAHTYSLFSLYSFITAQGTTKRSGVPVEKRKASCFPWYPVCWSAVITCTWESQQYGSKKCLLLQCVRIVMNCFSIVRCFLVQWEILIFLHKFRLWIPETEMELTPAKTDVG